MNTKIKKRMNENTDKEYTITIYLIVDDREEIEYHMYSKEPDRVEVVRFMNFLEHYYCHRDITIELVAFEVTCTKRTITDRAFL
jgi:hypothetical protein